MSKNIQIYVKPSQVMGAILSWVRQQSDMDQRSLAQSVGITQASWSRIENGNAVINIEQLISSCEAMNIDFSYLAKLYLHICNLLQDKSIIVSVNHPNSSTSSELEVKKIIKETIATHVFLSSNNAIK